MTAQIPRAALPAERYVFIDALRGIAAVAVLIDHLPFNSPLGAALETYYGSRIRLLGYGLLGVPVFFVISGFVITHSLRDTKLNATGIARFALRRQIRLDPPYWVAMVMAIALLMLKDFAGLGLKLPVSPGAIGLNIVYLNYIMKAPPVLGVNWTLAIEIQFYLFFSLLMFVTQRGRLPRQPTSFSIWAILMTGFVSLLFRPGVTLGAWMTQYWCYFAVGSLCYHVVRRQAAVAYLAATVTGLIVAAIVYHWSNVILTGAGTAICIYIVGRAGCLTTFLKGRVWQYFGRISYSLYLVHIPVILFVGSAGYHLTRSKPLWATMWALLAAACSILMAHVLFIWVERPTMRLASSLRRQEEKPRRDAASLPEQAAHG